MPSAQRTRRELGQRSALVGLTPVGSERSARTRLQPFAHSPPTPPLVRSAAPRSPRKHAHGGRAGQRHQASPPGAPAPARSCERNLELPQCAWQRPDGRWLSSQSLRCCWRSPHLVGRPLERNSGARAPRGVCMSAGCVWRETDKRREHRIHGVGERGIRGGWPRDRLQLVSAEVAARESTWTQGHPRSFSLQEPAHLDVRGSGHHAEPEAR